IPKKVKCGGDLAGGGRGAAWVGSDAFANSAISSGAIPPVFLRNPQTSGGISLGSTFMDLGALQTPTLPQLGPYVSPFYLRAPHRWNHDMSFFKNFNISERQKIQFRAGLFNIFNQAFPRYIQGDFSHSD